MKLTRNDLEKMLDEMDRNDTDEIEVYVQCVGHNDDFMYIDFNIYHGEEYHHTVLTLDP
jgi:hypothetical protein